MNYQGIFSEMKEGLPSDLIVIEGPTGVGKSTLMQLLADQFSLHTFHEHVEENTILEKYFFDREKYSFLLQIDFLTRRFADLKKACSVQNAILDRSFYGDIIFARLAVQRGEMSQEELAVYLNLYKVLLKEIVPPKYMIYIKSDMEVIRARIAERGRAFEREVPEEYWQMLINEYESFFEHFNICPVITVDSTHLNYATDDVGKAEVISYLTKKLNFISETKKISL